MPDSPLVTAVVVNLNGEAYLGDCLQSLFAQDYPALEVIVVDNGSTDSSVDSVIEPYGERINLLRNDRNLGFARGNNQAFERAKGEWVFLLNNDAVAEPDAISQLMTFVADKPGVGMLACRVSRLDKPNFFDSVGLLLYPDGVCRSRGWQEKDTGQYDDPEEVLAPHGCAAAYRKSMLDDIGAFDESYYCYLEDLDLGMRGQLADYKCWYVPSARVHHQKSATAGNYSKFKAFHVERNRIWNAVKLLPRFLLLVSPMFTLNRYLMQGYAAATHQGLSDEFVKEYSYFQLIGLLIRAYLSATLGLPRMLKQRRAISRKRRISTRDWYRLVSRFKLDAIELALKY